MVNFEESVCKMFKKRKKTLILGVLCAVANLSFSNFAAAEEVISDTEKAHSKVISTMSEQELSTHHLAEVVVEGRRYIAGEYVRATSNIGILGEQSIMDSPISVTTISEKAINDFNSSTDGLSGLLTLDPSVRFTGSPAVDSLSIRGFDVTGYGMTLNGVPGMFAMYRQTTNYIDSIDVIEDRKSGV